MSHRPGPWKWYWRANEEGHADCGVYSEEREGHAYSVCRAPRYASQLEWAQNAPVLTAAPDMKLALERARGCIKGLLARTPVRDVEETLAEIDAALTKADPSAVHEPFPVKDPT